MKNPVYILNPRNIKDKDFELVGREAMDVSILIQNGIPVPASFVVSSIAFDDFLVAGNIVGPIAKSLKNVRPFIKQTARDASQEIANYIIGTKFPDSILSQLAGAYANLTTHTDQPLVYMVPSQIIDEKFVVPTKNSPKEIIIKGIDDLSLNLKMAWLSLFSADAIEYRANGYYKDALSLSVVIQKLIRTEISGRVFTVSPATADKNVLEIKAAFGIEDKDMMEYRKYYDTYKIDKKTVTIVERNVSPQDYMIVRRGKIEKNENPNITVEISQPWRTSQKVQDDKILEIAKLCINIEEIFNVPIEIEWGIDSGEIYILGIDQLHIDFAKAKKDAVKLETPDKQKKPDFKALAQEINAIVQGDIPAPGEVKEIKDNLPDKELLDNHSLHIDLPELPKEKVKEDATISYLDDYEFATSMYLDISGMNSKVMAAMKYFSGSFYDGTEMILNNNVLPEELRDSPNEIPELIEKYSADISTASRTAVHKPMIYQFSTISQYELKLLGLDDNKYKYNYDERFLDYPQSLVTEALAVKKARTEYVARNIKISFSGIRNLRNFRDLKKIILSQDLKRSNAFKFYCEVAVPSVIFDLENFTTDDIDGIIVNYSKLLKMTSFRSEIREFDHEVGLKELQVLQKLCVEKNIEIFIRLDNFNDNLVDEIIKLKPTGLIFASIPTEDLLKVIKEAERK